MGKLGQCYTKFVPKGQKKTAALDPRSNTGLKPRGVY